MDYNTQRSHLLLPEYGRFVQKMVDYAVTIEDKSQRQLCAETIIRVMANLYPQQQDSLDFKHKLWDHLAAMSGYQLDVDYPYDIVPLEERNKKPQALPYPMTHIRYRHYGHLLETLIRKVGEMEPSETREQLTLLVANQMRMALQAWNKDSVSSEKIVSDLSDYTDGRLQIDPAECLSMKEGTTISKRKKK